MDTQYTILIPDVLGGVCDQVEHFYKTINLVPSALCYSFDMRQVTFVRPYGVMALLNIARLLQHKTKRPVQLFNLRQKVHSYLERTDLFHLSNKILCAKEQPNEIWSRTGSRTMLELKLLHSEGNLDAIIKHAHSIFRADLGEDISGLIVIVLHELCSNVVQHSRDRCGAVLIQRCHDRYNQKIACIRVAVSDLGIGVQRSLSKKYPELNESKRALQAVLEGRSSKSGKGGLGIRSVVRWASDRGGNVWIRSDTVALMCNSHSTTIHRNLTPIQGTQVDVEFRAS